MPLLLQNDKSCTDTEVERFQEVYRSGCLSYFISVNLVWDLLNANSKVINEEETDLLSVIYTPTANSAS